MNHNWSLTDAKRHFGQVVERALSQGAQLITRRGKMIVVVLAFDDYQKLTRRSDTLSQFLLSSPLAKSDLSIERVQDQPSVPEIEE